MADEPVDLFDGQSRVNTRASLRNNMFFLVAYENYGLKTFNIPPFL